MKNTHLYVYKITSSQEIVLAISANKKIE